MYDSDIRVFWQTKILDKFGYRNQLKGLVMLIKEKCVTCNNDDVSGQARAAMLWPLFDWQVMYLENIYYVRT